MNNPKTRRLVSLVALAAAAGALAACNRVDEQRMAERPVDTAVTTTEQKAKEAGASIKEAGRDTMAAVRSGAETVGDKAKDAAITTAVNAQLAADSTLSALRIDVDTVDSKVVLRGSAPDAKSKDHASTLASRIDGVVAVDNQLVVAPKS